MSKVILTEQISDSLTQEQADERYLQRSGDNLSSDFTLSYGSADVYGGKISLTERDGYATAKLATNDEYAQIYVNRHGVAIGCGDGTAPGEILVNNVGVIISGFGNQIYGSELSIDGPNALSGESGYVTVRFGSGGGEIIGLSDPQEDSCAANKAYVDATKALVVNITGTTDNYAADKTNAEIWAAYQAGRAVYAVWQGTVLYPYVVTAEVFWFVATAFSDQLSVVVQTDSGVQHVFVNQQRIADVRPKLRTATLTTSGWSSNSQTVTVNGIIANSASQSVDVVPADKASAKAWSDAGVWCDSQGTNSLTFSCETVPTANITLNIRFQEART